MKKAIVLSFIVMCIDLILSIIFKSWVITIKFCGIIGLICFVIAGILSNVFISGDRIRGNLSIETKEDKIEKNKITNFAIIIGVPNVILAVAIYFITNN